MSGNAITCTVLDGRVQVESPYNAGFVVAAKRLAGKWAAPAWVFDARNEAAVRSALRRWYGTDGTAPADTVSIQVALGEDDSVCRGPVQIAGRTIARAAGRDSGARLGDGVVLLRGGFDSGGSVKNWCTNVRADTAVLLHDIPRVMARKLAEDPSQGVTIVSEEPEAPAAATPEEDLLAACKLGLLLAEQDADRRGLPEAERESIMAIRRAIARFEQR